MKIYSCWEKATGKKPPQKTNYPRERQGTALDLDHEISHSWGRGRITKVLLQDSETLCLRMRLNQKTEKVLLHSHSQLHHQHSKHLIYCWGQIRACTKTSGKPASNLKSNDLKSLWCIAGYGNYCSNSYCSNTIVTKPKPSSTPN